jgi:hypothetical protein
MKIVYNNNNNNNNHIFCRNADFVSKKSHAVNYNRSISRIGA